MKKTGFLLYRKNKDQQYKRLFDVELLTNYSEGFGDSLVFQITDDFVLPTPQINSNKNNIDFLFLQDTDKKLKFGLLNFLSDKFKLISAETLSGLEVSLQVMIKLNGVPSFLGYIEINDICIDHNAVNHIIKCAKEGYSDD